MKLIYCDDHTCYCDEHGICRKCKENYPKFIRHRSEINPQNKIRIKDLEIRGLLK